VTGIIQLTDELADDMPSIFSVRERWGRTFRPSWMNLRPAEFRLADLVSRRRQARY
jgi:hypothetical protein